MEQIVVKDKPGNRDALEKYAVPFVFTKGGFLVQFARKERAELDGEWRYRTPVFDNAYITYSQLAGYVVPFAESTPNGLKEGDLVQCKGEANPVPYRITSIPAGASYVGVKGPMGGYSLPWDELEPLGKIDPAGAALVTRLGGL